MLTLKKPKQVVQKFRVGAAVTWMAKALSKQEMIDYETWSLFGEQTRWCTE